MPHDSSQLHKLLHEFSQRTASARWEAVLAIWLLRFVALLGIERDMALGC